MFKVNDLVLYYVWNDRRVCQVVDITKESFIDNLQKENNIMY